MPSEFFEHFFLTDKQRQLHKFSSARGGSEPALPLRNPKKHGEFLQKHLEKVWENTDNEHVARHVTRHGTYLEFKGEAGYELATKSLEDMRAEGGKGIRLLNVRREESLVVDSVTGKKVNKETIFATVFVSHNQRKHFFKKIQEYGHEVTATKGLPKHQKLLAGIADIERGDRLRCFWTDEQKLIPKKSEPEWCEAWLSCYGDVEESKTQFEAYLRQKKSTRSRVGLCSRSVLLKQSSSIRHNWKS